MGKLTLKEAQARNWTIFRLKGAMQSLRSIANGGFVNTEQYTCLHNFADSIEDILDEMKENK